MIVLIVVAYLVLYAFAFAHPRQPVDYHGRSFQLTLGHESDQTDKSLEEWISRESETAINHMLANIAPGGRNVEDAVSGTVVASPSREHPNYYFQCSSKEIDFTHVWHIQFLQRKLAKENP